MFEWNDTKDYIVARIATCSICFIDAEIVDERIKYLCAEIDVQKSNLHKSNDTNIRSSYPFFLPAAFIPFVAMPSCTNIVWAGIQSSF